MQIDRRIAGTMFALVMMPVLFTMVGFTMDVGRPPGPTEIVLNVFKSEIYKKRIYQYWDYIYYDANGQLQWSRGPAAIQRQHEFGGAVVNAIGRLNK